MNNLYTGTKSVSEGLDAAGKWLHSPKREAYNDMKAELLVAYLDYDNHTRPVTLERLMPFWVDLPGDTEDAKNIKTYKRKMSGELYGSNRPVITEHWKDLEQANGNTEIICPLCGVEEAREMDHYIPREVMPEHSVNLHNLIPLCSSCNNLKGSKWLDGHKRMIWNAFYDTLPRDIFTCCISVKKGIPCISFDINNLLDKKIERDRLVLSTIKELELMPKVSGEGNRRFRSIIGNIKSGIETEAPDFENRQAFWTKTVRTYSQNLIRQVDFSFIEILIYSEIIRSVAIQEWVETYIVNGI